MKCLNCGNENNQLLCDECQNEDIIDKIFEDILTISFHGHIDNVNIHNYASEFATISEIRNFIPDIIKIGEKKCINMDYYICRYYKVIKNPTFVMFAERYLEGHSLKDKKTQRILYDIISYYFRDNYEEPTKWCNLIYHTDDLAIELYNIASDYFSMIAEYEKANELNEKYYNYMITEKDEYIFSCKQSMMISYDRIKSSIIRYQTVKPYWPTTEERRLALAPIYERKGIVYPKIELKSKTIQEKDFKPIKELYDELPDEYVIFWCSYVSNMKSIKCIYEISALHIKNKKIIDQFKSFIRPWDGNKVKIAAAKNANVDIKIIEEADEVAKVMKKFINFITDKVLVSTEALSNQAKVLTRALRYSGYKEIQNYFFDVLDYASDVDSKFDLENNNRDYLLKYFDITEGNTSIEKAKATLNLIKELENYKESNDEFNL